jgi:hypothetical protein
MKYQLGLEKREAFSLPFLFWFLSKGFAVKEFWPEPRL